MGDIATLLMGGETSAQKAQDAQIAQQQQDALAQKITAIQGDVGTRTRDLVSRYGVVGGQASPLAAS